MAVRFDYRRFSAFPQNISGLPKWAQSLVVLAAIPGAILLATAALVALAGVIVIGLLALPAYRILRTLVGPPIGGAAPIPPMATPSITITSPEADLPPGERRQVESRIVE